MPTEYRPWLRSSDARTQALVDTSSPKCSITLPTVSCPGRPSSCASASSHVAARTAVTDRRAGSRVRRADEDELWTRVHTNLAARRLRLGFVADTIPTELRRTVEFLNEQMAEAEVLAVEVTSKVGLIGTPRGRPTPYSRQRLEVTGM